VRTVHLTPRAQRVLVKIERVATELRRASTRGNSGARLAVAIRALECVRDRLVEETPPAERPRRRPRRSSLP